MAGDTAAPPGLVELVTGPDGQILMYIIRGNHLPDRTTFVTPPEANLQVGFIVYGAGQEIQRHVHLPIERHTVGSNEVLVVKQGSCEVDVFTDSKDLVGTFRVHQGDVMITVGGGHGFRLLEDTVLLEVKQGPYPGVAEKERF